MKRVGMYRILLTVVLLLGLAAYSDTRRATQDDIGPVDALSGRQDIEVTQGVPALTLWNALCKTVPPGVIINSVSFPGAMSAWVLPQGGTYRNIPPINSVQMKDGIILASGYASSCKGPNSSGSTTFEGGYPGDPDLQAIVGTQIFDAIVLEIDFTSDNTIPGFSFVFCFGTEEWKEYLNSKFNDVFTCVFDGQNVTYDNQGNLICLNSVFFDVDNLDNHLNLEYDGFTAVLQTSQKISPGNHTIKFAIGDASDAILDAGVFLSDFRFDTTNNGTHPVINIIDDQEFTIDEKTQGGTTVGTITKLCQYGPITLLKMSNVPEFYLDGWDIVVSNGTNFDVTVQDEYVITVKATLDTMWGGDPWVQHDTADMTIKIEGSNAWPQIDKAVIYDNNGNGIGDSIRVKLKYDFPTIFSLEKADFSWPSGQIDYSENIDNGDLVNDDAIIFTYNPGATAPVWTDGQSTIDITIDSSGQSSTHSGDLEDGIGPVLKEAQCVKRYKPNDDTLRVRISEPIDVSALSGKSFILIKKDHVKEIEIEPIAGTVLDLSSESFVQFLIVDLGVDAPAEGDSLKILHTGPVIDKVSNKAHKDNPPVPIKFVGGNLDSWPQVKTAHVRDQDGDGIGDSICIIFDGIFVDSMTAQTAAYSWPENQIDYTETIDADEMYDDNTIAFSYAPGASAPVWTKGKSSVTVTIDSLGSTISRTADLLDGIGPILTEAAVVKRYIPQEDTFMVRLSEPVNVSAISGYSFILIKGNHVKEIDIQPVGDVEDLGNEEYIRFLVADLDDDAPAPGDSLKILHTGPVIDKVNNKAHKDNPPVPIKFINSNVPVKTAYYYDTDGNGIVDRVRLEFADSVNNIDEITFDVTFTTWNAVAKDVSASYETSDHKKVLLDLTNAFDSPAKVIDKTYGDMQVAITYTDPVTTVTYDVADKAAPVISRATYYLSEFVYNRLRSQDSLIVVFSENIKDVGSVKPFWLERLDGETYYLDLTQQAKTANRATFYISSVVSSKPPTEGDSIWINCKENVQDDLGNAQEVDDNKHVELDIEYPDFSFVSYVLGPFGPEEKDAGIEPDFQISTEIERGTVILLEPKIRVPIEILRAVSCRIKIFDAVGNELASCDGYTDDNELMAMEPVEKGPNNLIVILWSDKNYNNRDVGKGAYIGRIEITYDDGRSDIMKIPIPMKQ